MTFLPTIWAGTLSAGLSIAVIILLALYVTLQTGRMVHIILGIVTALFSLIVISSGVDSILVHGERSVLVFAAVGVGVISLAVLVYKTFVK